MKFYTPTEIAEMLKLNVATVYSYIKEGLIRANKFGRYYRIAEEDLKDFLLQSSTVKGGEKQN